MNATVYMVDEGGTLWEVDPSDCEQDGAGYWYLAADGEDTEEYCEDEYELED